MLGCSAWWNWRRAVEAAARGRTPGTACRRTCGDDRIRSTVRAPLPPRRSCRAQEASGIARRRLSSTEAGRRRDAGMASRHPAGRRQAVSVSPVAALEAPALRPNAATRPAGRRSRGGRTRMSVAPSCRDAARASSLSGGAAPGVRPTLAAARVRAWPPGSSTVEGCTPRS